MLFIKIYYWVLKKTKKYGRIKVIVHKVSITRSVNFAFSLNFRDSVPYMVLYYMWSEREWNNGNKT